MSKIAIGISFIKDSTFTIEPKFYEACILGKQHKIHTNERFIDTIDVTRVRIYVDFFNIRNILPDIGDYWYWVILNNEAIYIKFPMTIKLKDKICEKNKKVFNKIETYTDKKMLYFRSNNTQKYQLLVSYFNEKKII